MKTPTFICFTGIDGSGKTTLAKSVAERLNNNGTEYKYIYNRLAPFLLKPFIIIAQTLFLRGKGSRNNYAEYSATKRKATRKNPLSHLYQWLLLLDYCFQTLLKVKIRLMTGQSIICDRYVYDTIATDLAIDFEYSGEKIKQTLNRFFRLFPKPDLIFLVDVTEEIAYQRKNDIPSIDYLRERREVYLKMSKECEMIILDGSKDIAELQSEVEARIHQ